MSKVPLIALAAGDRGGRRRTAQSKRVSIELWIPHGRMRRLYLAFAISCIQTAASFTPPMISVLRSREEGGRQAEEALDRRLTARQETHIDVDVQSQWRRVRERRGHGDLRKAGYP